MKVEGYMKNDIILNKVITIERCINRIHEEYENNPRYLEDHTKIESIILNLQQAYEASIALVMHIVAEKKLGIPQNSQEAFTLLEVEGMIPSSLSQKMHEIVRFRDSVIHDYQQINLGVLQKIIENHLVDFLQFTRTILLY